MSKVKQWTYREFKKLLNKNGYSMDRSSGSHNIFKNAQNKTISVPSGRVLNKMLTRRLIKESNLT